MLAWIRGGPAPLPELISLPRAEALLGKRESQALRESFNGVSDGPRMPYSTFAKLMGVGNGESLLVSCLFKAFDRSARGSISEGEFLQGMSILVAGDQQSRIGLLFDMCDADRKGSAHVADVAALVRETKEWSLDAANIERSLEEHLVDCTEAAAAHAHAHAHAHAYTHVHTPSARGIATATPAATTAARTAPLRRAGMRGRGMGSLGSNQGRARGLHTQSPPQVTEEVASALSSASPASVAAAASASPCTEAVPAAVTASVAETLNERVAQFICSAAEIPPPLADSWTPIVMLQDMIYNLHMGYDVPWYLAIAGATAAARFAMFPFVIMQHRSTARMSNARPEMTKIQAEIEELKASGQMTRERQMEFAQKNAEVFKKHNVNILHMGIPFAQMPIFVSFFFACRSMAERFPSLSDGGIAWFLNLAQPDPYYVLPTISALTMLVTVEIGSMGNPSDAQSKRMKTFMRGFSFLIIPLTASFPASVHTYWVSSNLVSLLQTGFLKIPPVKSFFNIPKVMNAEEQAAEARKTVEVIKPVTYARNPKEQGRNK